MNWALRAATRRACPEKIRTPRPSPVPHFEATTVLKPKSVWRAARATPAYRRRNATPFLEVCPREFRVVGFHPLPPPFGAFFVTRLRRLRLLLRLTDPDPQGGPNFSAWSAVCFTRGGGRRRQRDRQRE